MLQNRLIVTKKSDRKKIYDLSKDKWIIELDGDKINNWDDFYDIMQKEIDIVNYDKKFGKNMHTYNDFATDIELYNEVKRRRVNSITIILDYTENFKNIAEGEKGYIFFTTIFILLLEWYRDLRIIYKQEKPTINIEMYILIDDNLLKNIPNYQNELIIAIEADKKEIDTKFKDYYLIELDAFYKIDEDYLKKLGKEIEDEDLMFEKLIEKKIQSFLEEIDRKVKKNKYEKIKVMMLNSDNLEFTYKRCILVDIVDNILIKKYKENKEIKIYMIFSDDIF